jgi:uncharacterized membrane protein (UPF0127 family)
LGDPDYNPEKKTKFCSQISRFPRQLNLRTRVINKTLKISVRNETKGAVLATSALVADSSETRRTGLLKHTALPEGEGLWIVPCEGVHSFWMKFSIDVLYLDREKKVRKIRHDMKPWKVSFCLPAHSVLELPAGTAKRTNTRPGDQLVFEKVVA